MSVGAAPHFMKSRSSSWGDTHQGAYNIAQGLRSFHRGSAFLPAFVIEGCHAQLDDIGFEFVQCCISTLDDRGIREQGLYRNCGVTSKVQKLMQLGLDKRKANGEKPNIQDEVEWETKTVSSAVKTFLRNLPEPLMTFDLHSLFINAAKMDDSRTRVDHIHYYVYQLPSAHKSMLEIVIRHLRRVADNCRENLMTVGNLGVCFGPTLLRPKEETMAAIMDIKFCNVVVEVLIANCEQIFDREPPKSIGQPCPPKPDHRAVQHEQSHPGASTTISIHRSVTDNGQRSSLSARPRAIAPPSPAIRTHSPKLMAANASIVTAASATAQIYDSVPSDSTGYGSAPKLVPFYGTASTSSDLPTPTTPPHGVARVLGRNRDDSSDSLNSMTSHGSDSPKIPPAEPRAKMSTSYAPPYNPLACETFSIQRVQAIPVGTTYPQDLSSIGNSTRTTSTSSVVSSFINPDSSMLPSRRVKTLYACTPDHESELCFQAGQIITNVYDSKEDGWLVGTLNGKTGLIPANYVEQLP